MNTIDRKFQIKLLKEMLKVYPHEYVNYPTSSTPISRELLSNLEDLVSREFIEMRTHEGDEGRIDAIMTNITEEGRKFLATLSD